jgi:hypothetical protein
MSITTMSPQVRLRMHAHAAAGAGASAGLASGRIPGPAPGAVYTIVQAQGLPGGIPRGAVKVSAPSLAWPSGLSLPQMISPV